MLLVSPLRPSTTMYEMYVQPRDVYTANKDGVSVFIRTAWTRESFPVCREHLRGTWTHVRPRVGIVYLAVGLGCPQEASKCP